MATVQRFDVVPRIAAEPLRLPLRIMVDGARFDVQEALEHLMPGEAGKVMQVSARGDHWRNDIVHLRGEIPLVGNLHAWSTRLLILEGTPERFEDLALAAGEIVRAGGPAVLVATAAEVPGPFTWTLFDVYAGIIHNRPLDEIVMGRNDAGVQVYFAHGTGGERLLLLSQTWEALQEHAAELRREVEITATQIDTAIESHKEYMHPAQLRKVRRRVPELRSLNELTRDLAEAKESLDWTRETGAALPMGRALEKVPAAAAAADELRAALDDVAEQLRNEASNAPRVLNANFLDRDRIVEPSQPLRPATEYALLIDVGPRWSTIPSIVTGSDAFPDRYLPSPKAGGHRIRVTVVSDDFTPHLVSAEIFVPAGGGRSFPVSDGVRAGKAGPTGILLRTPETGERRRARARFCLYYEGNLIQSGVLSAVVAPPGTSQHPGDGNELKIDFALSGALRDFEALGGGEGGEPRVAFNVTLNDDGAGGHRFILNNSSDPMPAYTTYDPKGAEEHLKEFREVLLGLFYTRNERRELLEEPGLDADNGKELRQFRRDLWTLADVGRKFFLAAFGEVRPEAPGEQALAWTKKMQKALRQRAVIQIARTGPAQYVYPWGLLYVHGLTGDPANWRYCEVIDEQWPNGRRTGPPDDSCPYQKVAGDHDNTICPYGFWGLRHIVEQPLPVGRMEDGEFVLQNAATEIHAGGTIRFAVATTTDAALDANAIAAHLSRLGTRPGVQIVPEVAHDANEALNVMQETELVYVLCHGEFDAVKKEAYLGIGPKGAGRDHRIYTSTFQEWALKEGPPNLDAWGTRRPLVMINGCHTSDLQPGDVLNFVSALSMVNAAGVVGTEVSVQLRVALEVAQTFFEKLLPRDGQPGLPVGEAMHHVRWELANKGNLLGLAYTTYCLSKLQVLSA